MPEHAVQSTPVPTIILLGQEIKLLKQLLLFGFEEQVTLCVTEAGCSYSSGRQFLFIDLLIYFWHLWGKNPIITFEHTVIQLA